MIETSVAVIGGGASGLSAAMYLAKAGIDALTFDHDKSVLHKAYLKNYPGKVEPLTGITLRDETRSLCEQYGAKLLDDPVEQLTTQDGKFLVVTSKDSYLADYAILATGQTPLKFLDVPADIVDGVQPFVKSNLSVSAEGETSVPNLFAAGVVAGHPSQAIVAAGDGARVAVHVISRIKGEYWVDHDVMPKQA
ncbi:MAG: NAD(P)/FAD-dependent oxidoreductase [Cyanobacteria bacterium P01_F01_bin.3]